MSGEMENTPPGRSSAVAVRESESLEALEKRMSLFRELAVTVVKAKLAPRGLQTPEQVMVAMQTGAELGLPPMRALSCVTVINGRAGLMGEAALALLRRDGVLEPGTDLSTDYTGEGDAFACVARLHRRGQPDPFVQKFSVAMAKKAGLWGKQGPWRDYPQRMLMWRAVGFLLKDHFTDVLMGLPLEAELRDIPPVRRAEHPRDLDALAPEATGPDPLLEAAARGETIELTPTPNPEGEGEASWSKATEALGEQDVSVHRAINGESHRDTSEDFPPVVRVTCACGVEGSYPLSAVNDCHADCGVRIKVTDDGGVMLLEKPADTAPQEGQLL